MPAPLVVAGLAAAGFIKGGGLGGIIGSGKRKREEQEAKVAQREAEYNYFNFDFNQDVGDIYNPYAQIAKSQTGFEQENIDKASARLIDQHERAGVFGATTGVLNAQTEATRQSAQRIQSIQQAGARFVEAQRQKRIDTLYDQAGTQLGRADYRLAEAKRARDTARKALYKGIGAGITAGLGAASAGPDASFGEALNASGLLPVNVAGGGDPTEKALIQNKDQIAAEKEIMNQRDLLSKVVGNPIINQNYTLPTTNILNRNRVGTVDVGQHQITGGGYTNLGQYGY